MKTALYFRVSTLDQSTDLQRRELLEFARNSGHEVTKTYEDKMSGSKAMRPGLDDLLAAMRRGEFQAVIVWKLSRLGRSVSHLLSLFEEFQLRGVRVISRTESLDFESPMGRAMIRIAAVFAELERETIVENVRAGLAAAKDRGVKLGRPVRQIPAETLSEAARMRKEGMSWSTLAETLEIPASTIRAALQNTSPGNAVKNEPKRGFMRGKNLGAGN